MKKILAIHSSLTNSLHLQNYTKFSKYIISPYVVKVECDKGMLWYNNLTCELLLLEKNEEYDEKINKFLIEHWYYFPDFVNPKTFAYTVRQIVKNHNYERNSHNISNSSFVIPTTTACNARCPYCFEYALHQRHMTKEMALEIAKYLVKQSENAGKIHICWFGGEPLCNKEVIDIICDYLNEHNVEFNSSMITNGYLIDTLSLRDVKYKWCLTNVQVTLDGTKSIYEKIKNYKDNKNNSYEKVLNNIETFLENGVKVSIRMNVGLYNGDDLFELAKELASKFRNYKKLFSMYATPLFLGEGNPPLVLTDEESHKVIDDCIKIETYLNERHLSTNNGIQANRFKSNHCMADKMNAPVITIDGNLTPCEHYFEEHICGNIYDGIVDYELLEKWTELDIDSADCETCFWYPKCFHLKSCPDELICEEPQKKFHMYKLKTAILNSYNKYCETK